MSFGAQPNQPWQRNIMPFQNVAPQQMYMQSGFQHAGPIPTNQIYGNAVVGNVSVPYQQSYNSVGTVTKINNDCGLVNDEVFFYRNVCKGTVPKLGERVIFESNLSTTGQFKWNATRIQSIAPQPLMSQPISAGLSSDKGSRGYSNVPPPDYRAISPSRDRAYRAERLDRVDHADRLDRMIDRIDRSDRNDRVDRLDRNDRVDRDVRPERRDRDHRSRERDEGERERKRRREENGRSREISREKRAAHNQITNTRSNREEARRDRDHSNERKERERRERMREREREHEREREREREKERNTSPKGRAQRGIRRYKVQLPKHSLVCHELTIPEIRQRYPSLYIPSLFFHADIIWPQTFTFEKPFSLRRACQFHIMHETVEPLVPFKKEELEPSDVDYSYSAKVILMECPSLADIYQKCFKDEGEDGSNHLSRLIRFIFGSRGDNSPMAIGGYWSPSLDGPNPSKDPSVLIRTAIRTCRSLTGIDLSNCTQWYRFCEYHYESETTATEQARVETVVIFLPDIHSCMPTVDEWKKLTSDYKAAAENCITEREQLVAANGAKVSSGNGDEADSMDTTKEKKSTPDANKKKPTASAAASPSVPAATTAAAASAKKGTNIKSKGDAKTPTKQQAAVEKSTDGDKNENEKGTNKNEPTHYSKLDLKTMKVQEMRDELIARELPSKGVRTVIMARLAKAINTEKAEEMKAAKEARRLKLNAKRDGMKRDEPKKDIKPPKADEDDDVQIISDDNEDETKNTSAKEKETNDKNQTEEKSNQNNEQSNETKNGEQEDQEEWEGGMDVDMNEMVVVDEYDSRKNPDGTPLKELTEKDKDRIRRRYTLPSTPHIIVHPNKAAKSGKFDCVMNTLAAMLDYTPSNSKQRFFEVALFAELFKEMLMRDFSFNIYKEIYFHNEAKTKEQEETAESKEKSSSNKEDKSAQKNGEKPSKENNTNDSKSDVSQNSKVAGQKRKAVVLNGNEKDKEKEKEKDKETTKEHKNMVTVKPHLLLSFLYFDATHCGYIYKRDLEELFYLCGLSVSRSQIHAFLDKVSTTNAFDYRKITDKEAKPDEEPAIEDIEDIESEVFKKIAAGNFALFDDFNLEDEENADGAAEPTTAPEDGLVNYNGTVVHVGKLVDQIKRTEKSLSDIEKLFNDLRKEHNELQKNHTRTNRKLKDVETERKRLSQKVGDTNRNLNTINRKYREEHEVILSIDKLVTPFIRRDRGRSHKSESSRKDKDKGKGKEKEKEKDDKRRNEKSDKDKKKDQNKDDKDKSKSSNKTDEDKEKSKSEKITEPNENENENGQDTENAENVEENEGENEEENEEEIEEEYDGENEEDHEGENEEENEGENEEENEGENYDENEEENDEGNEENDGENEEGNEENEGENYEENEEENDENYEENEDEVQEVEE